MPQLAAQGHLHRSAKQVSADSWSVFSANAWAELSTATWAVPRAVMSAAVSPWTWDVVSEQATAGAVSVTDQSLLFQSTVTQSLNHGPLVPVG